MKRVWASGWDIGNLQRVLHLRQHGGYLLHIRRAGTRCPTLYLFTSYIYGQNVILQHCPFKCVFVYYSKQILHKAAFGAPSECMSTANLSSGEHGSSQTGAIGRFTLTEADAEVKWKKQFNKQ